MTWFIEQVLSAIWPYILAGGAALIGLLVAFMRGRVTGAQRERDKQARERLEARAEADKIDDAVAGLSDEEVMKRQSKWSRKR